MKEHDLKKLLENNSLINQKIKNFQQQKIITTQKFPKYEIQGHIQKAQHDLRFVSKIINTEFTDWVISGCYYACYHIALALILTKNCFSKNHLATLLVLIKEFYKKELDDEDILFFSQILNYEDLKFYVEAKNKREHATYSTKTIYDKKETELLRIKTTLFFSKLQRIIEKQDF